VLLHGPVKQLHIIRHVCLAYQSPASSTFLSEQTSHQQPTNSIFLSEQSAPAINHQPNEQTDRSKEHSWIFGSFFSK
jgi:hypothetical protein